MAMYLKDKPNRITLRLTDDQFVFLKANSDQLGVSPSEFLRMVITSALVTARKVESGVPAETAVSQMMFNSGKGTVEGRENDETNSDNLV